MSLMSGNRWIPLALMVLMGLLPQAKALDESTGAAGAEAYSVAVGMQAFEMVWRTVRDQHFDPDLNGVDWNAVRRDLEPRAKECVDLEALRGVIEEMLSRLGQSHFELIPGEKLPADGAPALPDLPAHLAGSPGFDVRLRDGLILVHRVDPEGPAAAAGIGPGWMLLGIDARSADEILAEVACKEGVAEGDDGFGHAVWRWVNDELSGEVGSKVELQLLDADDSEQKITVARGPRDVIPFNLGPDLPTFYLKSTSRRIERESGDVGYLFFSNWFDPLLPVIDAVIASMQDTRGIILDLRGNTGGDGSMVGRVAGNFFAEPTEIGVQKMRRGSMSYSSSSQRFGPDRQDRGPYLGPVAILVDETTASSSEVFCGGMQSVGRVRVFGEITAGAVLPATLKRLPTGDSLMYAIGDFRTANGTLLEGLGVIPDEIIPLQQDELLAGVDAPLEAALRWMGGQAR